MSCKNSRGLKDVYNFRKIALSQKFDYVLNTPLKMYYITPVKIFLICSLFSKLHFFYKQLGSGLSPQRCLYFQNFRGSNLLKDCLVVWSSNLCLRGIQGFSRIKIDIYNQCLWSIFFLILLLRQLNFGVLSG